MVSLSNLGFRIALFASIIISGATSTSAGEIVKPLRFPTKMVPYEADRIIRMTLHEYKTRGPRKPFEVTGRYVTFGIPMKYIAVGQVFPDQVPTSIRTFLEWIEDPDGSFRIAAVRDENGIAPRGFNDSARFRVRAGNHIPNSRKLKQELVRARASGQTFPGYRRAAGRGKLFWMRETYCGFDIYEVDGARYHARFVEEGESLDTRARMNPPLNIGRVFGFPEEAGGYKFAAECKERPKSKNADCQAKQPFNEYITLLYSFDSSQICRIADIMAAHKMFMTDHVFDKSVTREDQ